VIQIGARNMPEFLIAPSAPAAPKSLVRSSSARMSATLDEFLMARRIRDERRQL